MVTLLLLIWCCPWIGEVERAEQRGKIVVAVGQVVVDLDTCSIEACGLVNFPYLSLDRS